MGGRPTAGARLLMCINPRHAKRPEPCKAQRTDSSSASRTCPKYLVSASNPTNSCCRLSAASQGQAAGCSSWLRWRRRRWAVGLAESHDDDGCHARRGNAFDLARARPSSWAEVKGRLGVPFVPFPGSGCASFGRAGGWIKESIEAMDSSEP